MRKLIVLCLLSALVGGLAAFGLHTAAQSPVPEGVPWPGQAPPPAAAARRRLCSGFWGGIPQDALTLEEQVNVFVYQQANRSVVNINTKGVSGNALLMFEIISEGEGSGIVIDREGRVLTNFHVVDGRGKSTSPSTTARPTTPGSWAAIPTPTWPC